MLLANNCNPKRRLRAGRGGDSESDAGGTQLGQEFSDTSSQHDLALLDDADIMSGFNPVEVGIKRVGAPRMSNIVPLVGGRRQRRLVEAIGVLSSSPTDKKPEQIEEVVSRSAASVKSLVVD